MQDFNDRLDDHIVFPSDFPHSAFYDREQISIRNRHLNRQKNKNKIFEKRNRNRNKESE